MTDQPDRIRVWNAETMEMMEPATIQEMLCMERNTAYIRHVPEDYGYLVFMRNTGIFDHQSKTLRRLVEIFADDLVTHSTEPYVYRVKMGADGCWLAVPVIPAVLGMRLNMMHHPQIVGNVFENRELFERGEIDE